MLQWGIRDEMAAVLGAFEDETGLRICIRPFGATWRDAEGIDVVPRRHGLHDAPFCWRVKRRRLRACVRDDFHRVRSDCEAADGAVFVRRCHAGAGEIITPVLLHGGLAGVIFLGPFREREDGPSDLPLLDAARIARLRRLCLALRSYLVELLGRLLRQRTAALPDRHRQIENFCRERLRLNPSLGDLAGALHLSPSRTGHLVRELTGKSFDAFKEELRLEAARDMLEHSDLPVADVARAAGLQDPAYFSRYFRHRIGLTPSQYREGKRASPSA